MTMKIYYNMNAILIAECITRKGVFIMGYSATYLIVSLIVAIVFGLITKSINNSRGREGGFWWGFFLNVIGIIVVACRPKE